MQIPAWVVAKMIKFRCHVWNWKLGWSWKLCRAKKSILIEVILRRLAVSGILVTYRPALGKHVRVCCQSMTPYVHRLLLEIFFSLLLHYFSRHYLQSVSFFKPTTSAQIAPIFKHVEGVWIKCPEATLASFFVDSSLLYEALVQAQIMSVDMLIIKSFRNLSYLIEFCQPCLVSR